VPQLGQTQEIAAQKELMARRWHDYGEKFSLIIPDEQPYLTVWDPELPDTDEKERLSPQALKILRYLFS